MMENGVLANRAGTSTATSVVATSVTTSATTAATAVTTGAQERRERQRLFKDHKTEAVLGHDGASG